MTNKAFGDLRALLSQRHSAWRESLAWSEALLQCLDEHRAASPSDFNEVWMPYLEESMRASSFPAIEVYTQSLDDAEEMLNRVRSLMPDAKISFRMDYEGLEEDGVAELFGFDGIEAVTRLELGRVFLEPDGVLALVNHLRLCTLSHLFLEENDVEPQGALYIAQSDTMQTLNALTIRDNRIGNVGLDALANSSYLSNLHTLNLGGGHMGNAFDCDGMLALSQSSSLSSLKHLDLSLNNIGLRGVEMLLDATFASSLETLNLDGNDLQPNVVRLFQSSERFVSLKNVQVD